MTSQPPLLYGSGSSLPGPQFVPRPGWGGRLGGWLSRNGYSVVFRIVVIVALVLVARSLFGNRSTTSPLPSATVSPITASLRPISIKALAGDGMTNLAARALDVYLALQSPAIRLDSAQHLFAVTTLTRTVSAGPLKVNQEVTFLPTDIASLVDRALKLTPAQHAAWMRLLK